MKSEEVSDLKVKYFASIKKQPKDMYMILKNHKNAAFLSLT